MGALCVIGTPKANGLSFYLRHAFCIHLFYLVLHNLRFYGLSTERPYAVHPGWRRLQARHPPRNLPSTPMKPLNVIIELGIQISVLLIIL